ncbi:protein kinase domain-containing protein [Mariniblastus fucicola]|uniref:Serine/threonine-protein kinase PknB n=1 Tax=Mariniblastus fucicola TaxID=980251 RepID=A0A5B9P5S1_9BACT|nr:protein kinase [Mariniblastus fucicola]QEG21917.1 Serine/threonine-protein kinase PknB [Mariniblastus fucicola]
MNAPSTPECPQPETLSQFLLGKLDPKTSLECESHLADCEPCVETINGLQIDDTFHSLVVGTSAEDPESVTDSDESVVSNLIHRLIDAGAKSQSGAAVSTPNQRAADVLGMLDSPSGHDSIGQIEHYRIEEVLGCGSTGVVFRAVDENLDRPVAIKVLRPTLGDAARQRFVEEAKATAKLNHPNIVTIFHVGDSGPLAFIVMQWLPGETLEDRLSRQSVLPSDTVRKLGTQIALGLSAAHQKGLVHRDIKPANLWITEEDQIKILDFGLVRMMDESPQLTCTGMIAGTPCFMSPEQSRGDELDARSDLFSLGCVLYQCLCGKLPFVSSNALATLQAIQRLQPESPASLEPTVDSDLSDLVMMLLEKSATRRPKTSRDLAIALEANRSDWPFECSPQPDSQIDSKHVSRTQTNGSFNDRPFSLWKTVAGVLAIAALGWAGFLFGPQIIRVASNEGLIVIETDDPDVQIEVLQGGEQIEIVDLKTKQELQIRSGSYQIRAVGDDNSVTIDNAKLTLSRGETEIVKVTRIEDFAQSETPKPMPGNLSGQRQGNRITSDTPSDASTNQEQPVGGDLSSGIAVDPFHKVGPGDILNIHITNITAEFGELTEHPFPVRIDGTLSLPLTEPIKVVGLTALDIETLVRERYIGKILKKESSYVSVKVAKIYHGNLNSQTLAEPVYNGMTFEQCLNAIKFERDGEKLEKPVLGMIELKDAASHPELIDPMLEAVFRIRKVDYNSSVALSFLNWLTDEQLQQLAIKLISGTDSTHWNFARRSVMSPQRSWERLAPIESELASISIAALDESQTSSNAARILCDLIQNEDVSDATKTRIVKPMLEHAHENKMVSSMLFAVASFDSRADGLSRAFSKAVASHPDRFHYDWYGIIKNFDKKNRRESVAAFVRIALSEKYAEKGNAFTFFQYASDDVFEIAYREFEKMRDNGEAAENAFETITKRRAEIEKDRLKRMSR